MFRISILVFSLSASAAYASSVVDLTEIGVGARPLGMGKAFSSVADDGSALFTNPAGLTAIQKFGVISMSGNLLNEAPYLMLGGAWRHPTGVWGLGYVGASAGGIRETILVNGTPEITGAEANYGAATLLVSYANEAKEINYVKNIIFLTERKARVGATLKLASHGFSGGTSFEGGNSSGFDLDIGTQFPVNDRLTTSILLKNLIPGNNVGKDELPLGLAGGIAYQLPERNMLTALEAELSNGAFLLHGGVEWNPLAPLFLRAGLDQAREGFNLALGLGTRYRGFSFDYAYHTYAELSEFTTHYFSLGYIGEVK